LGSGYINVLNIFSGTSPGSGSFFADTARLGGTDGTTGAIGSINIGGGMPTQVNVTSNLATAGNGTGTGDDTAGSASGTGGGATGAFGGSGVPLRVNWRELVNTQN
jgi:type IV pilus assembly protein PilY1